LENTSSSGLAYLNIIEIYRNPLIERLAQIESRLERLEKQAELGK